jgi:hypothetical protein
MEQNCHSVEPVMTQRKEQPLGSGPTESLQVVVRKMEENRQEKEMVLK